MMTRPSLTVVAAAIGLACGGCYHSLHSPRPLADGEAQIGLHAGAFAYDADADTDNLAPVFVVTTRYGLGHGIELGLDVGSTGPIGSAKYGFLDHDSALQISVVASAGLVYWHAPTAGGGALLGYTIADVVMPYAGYRYYGLFGDPVETGAQLIAGLDIELSDALGLLIEGVHDEASWRERPVIHFSGGVTYTFK